MERNVQLRFRALIVTRCSSRKQKDPPLISVTRRRLEVRQLVRQLIYLKPKYRDEAVSEVNPTWKDKYIYIYI